MANIKETDLVDFVSAILSGLNAKGWKVENRELSDASAVVTEASECEWLNLEFCHKRQGTACLAFISDTSYSCAAEFLADYSAKLENIIEPICDRFS